MKLIQLVAFILLLILPANAQPDVDIGSLTTEQLVEDAPRLHPAALYVLSARLLEQGQGQEAANWMYAGQLRYRFLVASLGDAAGNERILLSALTEQVGRPVNEYIAGDPDEWIAAMEWALAWDEAHDNLLTSKTEFSAELEEIRSGLRDLIETVDTSRDQIREQRRAAGLPKARREETDSGDTL